MSSGLDSDDDYDDEVCESGASLSTSFLFPQLVVMMFDLQNEEICGRDGGI